MEKSTATRSASHHRQAAASLAQRRQSGAGTAGVLSDEVGQRTGAGFGLGSEKVAASQQLVDNSPRVAAQRKQIESAFGMPVQRQGSEEEELLQGKFDLIQRQGPEEEELLQGKFATAQRQGPEEEELLQGKFDPLQRQGSEEEELSQGKFGAEQLKQGPAPRANDTGLPDNLKGGIEKLSGMSMDDVKVHYNSSQPVQLDALAYAQGTDIHVGPGQERHLPHEAWHLVQQAQGRVQPTMQMSDGVSVNDDTGLEREADMMGAKAAQLNERPAGLAVPTGKGPRIPGAAVQLVMDYDALLIFVRAHRPADDVHDPYHYAANHWEELEAAGYEATEEERGQLKFVLGNVKGEPAEEELEKVETKKEKMTETDAKDIADEKGWTPVTKFKISRSSGHNPGKAKVYTDGEYFYSADSAGHVGHGFKRYSGRAMALVYEGTVSSEDTDKIIPRSTQRTETKKQGRK